MWLRCTTQSSKLSSLCIFLPKVLAGLIVLQELVEFHQLVLQLKILRPLGTDSQPAEGSSTIGHRSTAKFTHALNWFAMYRSTVKTFHFIKLHHFSQGTRPLDWMVGPLLAAVPPFSGTALPPWQSAPGSEQVQRLRCFTLHK